MSFGFTVDDDAMTYEDGAYLRRIKSVGKLYDVSAVSIPANGNTVIVSARKHCDGVIAELETERAKAEEEARLIAEKRENLLMKLKGLKNGN